MFNTEGATLDSERPKGKNLAQRSPWQISGVLLHHQPLSRLCRGSTLCQARRPMGASLHWSFPKRRRRSRAGVGTTSPMVPVVMLFMVGRLRIRPSHSLLEALTSILCRSCLCLTNATTCFAQRELPSRIRSPKGTRKPNMPPPLRPAGTPGSPVASQG